MEQIYVPVHIPNPNRRVKDQQARRDPKNAQMIKMREAAAHKHRLMTKAKQDTLLNYLRSPSPDFDGGNEAIARALTISTRTVIRLMNGLAADGRIKINRYTAKTVKGFRTHREITLLQELS